VIVTITCVSCTRQQDYERSDLIRRVQEPSMCRDCRCKDQRASCWHAIGPPRGVDPLAEPAKINRFDVEFTNSLGRWRMFSV
jgi:hypothetical protein